MTTEVRFTDRELDVMSILWRERSGTVAEVRSELTATLSYTGVLKVLQILESKGLVRHEPEGRAYRYYPVAEAADAGALAMGRIVDKIFQGSPALALASLLTGRTIEPDEAERMKAILEEAAPED